MSSPHPMAARCSARPLVFTAVLLLGLAWLAGGSEPARRLETELAPHGTLRWDRGSEPELLVLPRRGDGWLTVARRMSGTIDTAGRLRASNPGLPAPKLGRLIHVPLQLLRADLRLASVRRLFPADRRVVQGWEHWVLDPFDDRAESWDWLAELFTGQPSLGDTLRVANSVPRGVPPQRGQHVVIPANLLLACYRNLRATGSAAAPTPRPTPSPTPTRSPAAVATPRPAALADPARGNGVLTFGRDAAGEHAVYRLRLGEALYSSVVVRFTGQLSAVQVNSTAAEIARRSGIADVTSIPVGYPIKIPLDLLLPEYLPAAHPRRVQWEAERLELARYVEVVHAADLAGVHVILDAGHGGRDTGAVHGKVWESTHVYDIMCRIRENLSRHTNATVWTTIKDTSSGLIPPNSDRLLQDRDQILLTHPPFDLAGYSRSERSVAVHLRWYLANSIVRQVRAQGVPASKVVFLSVHADSLHPTVRGAMVYVPSRHLRSKSYTVKTSSIRGYREYRESPTVRLSGRFMAKAEASSQLLAERIIAAVRSDGMAVHPYRPIRDRVLRGRRSWVPAVLRYSQAQNAVLVECCNLANAEDLKNIRSKAWREQFARAVVTGLASAFAGD